MPIFFGKARCIASVGIVLMIAQAEAPAAERADTSQLALSAGLIWSDNITLTALSKKSDGILDLGIRAANHEESVRLHSDIDANLDYQRYLGGQFRNELVGEGAGFVSLGLLPERIEWVVQDNFAQVRTIAVAADTPNNRQNVNYLSTGPRLTYAIDPRNYVRVDGRYSLDSYSASALNGNRATETISLVHKFAEAESISLNGSNERHQFDNSVVNEAYTTRQAYLGYVEASARTQVTADLGYAQVDAASATSGGAVGRLLVRREISPSNFVRVFLAREYLDAANELRTNQYLAGVEQRTELILAARDPFVREVASVSWDLSRNRTGLGLDGSYSTEDHTQLVANNRKLIRYGAYATRQVWPTLTARAQITGTRETFDVTGARADEVFVTLAADWSFSSQTMVNFQVNHRGRSGNGPIAAFTENRVIVSLTWQPLSRH